MKDGWMGMAARAALAAAVALGTTAAIGKNDGARDRDDADKRERDRRECPDGREHDACERPHPHCWTRPAAGSSRP